MYYPTINEYKRLREGGSLVPVYKEILADLETPISIFLKTRAGYSFLLESALSIEKIGRYSFIGVSPSTIFRAYFDRVEIVRNGKIERLTLGQDPLSHLITILDSLKPASLPGLPIFWGGAVGYIGYDYIRYIEHLPPKTPEDLEIPLSIFVIPENIIIFDHQKAIMKIVATIPEASYQKACESIEAIAEKLSKPLPKDIYQSPIIAPSKPIFEFPKEGYKKAVLRAKEYIKAGDIFQVVPSQRIRRKTKASPISIYRALRQINPSPYMYLLDFDELSLIGSSPELLVKVENGFAETRPLAGTRRRGNNEAEDKRLEKELLLDEKERAEHLMLVDLGRNDLGRVCEFATITLPDFMSIERYSHVMHIMTSVRGKVKDGISPLDVLRACFPAGTLSGAPKVRACEIIDELEPVRRGVYAGCVGYFSFSGNMDTCITIRTILLHQGTAYIQAGAGIVADSDPEMEYKESLNKASAMLSAIDLAEGGLVW
ncbi:anthranilate synthase component I [bacterium]|nr:anthranilate synthase component I [bacterium]